LIHEPLADQSIGVPLETGLKPIPAIVDGTTVAVMAMDSVSVLVNAFRTVSLMVMDSGRVLVNAFLTVSVMVMDSGSV